MSDIGMDVLKDRERSLLDEEVRQEKRKRSFEKGSLVAPPPKPKRPDTKAKEKVVSVKEVPTVSRPELEGAAGDSSLPSSLPVSSDDEEEVKIVRPAKKAIGGDKLRLMLGELKTNKAVLGDVREALEGRLLESVKVLQDKKCSSRRMWSFVLPRVQYALAGIQALATKLEKLGSGPSTKVVKRVVERAVEKRTRYADVVVRGRELSLG